MAREGRRATLSPDGDHLYERSQASQPGAGSRWLPGAVVEPQSARDRLHRPDAQRKWGPAKSTIVHHPAGRFADRALTLSPSRDRRVLRREMDAARGRRTLVLATKGAARSQSPSSPGCRSARSIRRSSSKRTRPSAPPAELHIAGKVGSPVKIVGPVEWNSERGVLRLGSVSKSQVTQTRIEADDPRSRTVMSSSWKRRKPIQKSYRPPWDRPRI